MDDVDCEVLRKLKIADPQTTGGINEEVEKELDGTGVAGKSVACRGMNGRSGGKEEEEREEDEEGHNRKERGRRIGK